MFIDTDWKEKFMTSAQEKERMQFCRRHLATGDKLTHVARWLGVPHLRLYRWIHRGRIPQPFLQDFSDIFGVTIEEMKAVGIEGTSHGNAEAATLKRDVLPLLRGIVESGLDKLTLEEFDHLLRTQDWLHLETMSSVMIKELVLVGPLRRTRKGS